jgi:hypothetical protein
MDVEDRVETWRSVISLSSGSLGEAVVQCRVADGLLLWSINDLKTPIQLDVSVIYIIKTQMELPLTITIQYQPEPSDGAIAWLAPQHPVAIVLNGDKGIGDELALWHVVSGPVELSMSQKIIEEPSLIDVGVSWALHPLAISFYLILSLTGVLVWLRRSNAIDITLFEHEITNDDETEEERVTDEHYQEVTVEDYEDNFDEDYEEEEVDDEPVRVRKKRLDSTGAEIKEPVKRVRVVKASSQSKPVMKKRAVKKKVPSTKKRTAKRRKPAKSEDDIIDDALDRIL